MSRDAMPSTPTDPARAPGAGASFLRRHGKRIALLFIAVFPANVQFTADSLGNPKAPPAVKIISVLRLPLQIPLVTTALKIRRAA